MQLDVILRQLVQVFAQLLVPQRHLGQSLQGQVVAAVDQLVFARLVGVMHLGQGDQHAFVAALGERQLDVENAEDRLLLIFIRLVVEAGERDHRFQQGLDVGVAVAHHGLDAAVLVAGGDHPRQQAGQARVGGDMALLQAGFGIRLQAVAEIVDTVGEVVARIAGQQAQRLHVEHQRLLHADEVLVHGAPLGVVVARQLVARRGQIRLFAFVGVAVAARQFAIAAQLGRGVGEFAHFGEADRAGRRAAAQHQVQDKQEGDQEQGGRMSSGPLEPAKMPGGKSPFWQTPQGAALHWINYSADYATLARSKCGFSIMPNRLP